MSKVTCSITLNRKNEYKQIWVRRPVAHLYKKHYTDNKQSLTKDMRGNRGLNTQQVMDGIGTRCVGRRQDKTNGKWKMDQRWLEDRWRRTPSTAWTRRGNDFGRSRDICRHSRKVFRDALRPLSSPTFSTSSSLLFSLSSPIFYLFHHYYSSHTPSI